MRSTSRRSIVIAAGAAALVGATIAIPSSASAATGPDVAIVRAHVVGGVTSAQAGDPLTFVFTATNNGPGPADLAITLVWAHGIDLNRDTSRLSCVLPNGTLIEPDGDNCEPGFIRPGQRPSRLVFTGVATGTDVDVKVCVSDLSGRVDPVPRNNCRDPRVAVPGPSVAVTSGIVVPPEKTHVNMFVSVACSSPPNVTSYLTIVIWQGISPQPNFIQGQGQTEVVCDGVKRSYSFEAVRDPAFAPNVFKAGPAMAETNVTYCVQLDPDNGVCYALGEVEQQPTHFRRL
jgi:hypothetical protein